MEMETPEHKTLNNTLVTTNKVLNNILIQCKPRPLTYITPKQLRITGSFYLRDRNWKTNTPE